MYVNSDIKLLTDTVPTFKYASSPYDIYIVFDTGATTSVFTKSESKFKRAFPDAYFSGEMEQITGFGNKDKESIENEEYSPIWIIPVLTLGELNICNVRVALKSYKKDRFGVDLILASNILHACVFSISLKERYLRIEYPHNNIQCKSFSDENGVKHSISFYQDSNVTDSLITDVGFTKVDYEGLELGFVLFDKYDKESLINGIKSEVILPDRIDIGEKLYLSYKVNGKSVRILLLDTTREKPVIQPINSEPVVKSIKDDYDYVSYYYTRIKGV